MKLLVLVHWDSGPRFGPARPGGDQTLAQGATSLDKECTRTHGRVADLQVQHLLRRGVRTQPIKCRLQRILDDWSREGAWRVMAAGLSPLASRLQDRCAHCGDPFLRGSTLINHPIKGCCKILNSLGYLHGFG